MIRPRLSAALIRASAAEIARGRGGLARRGACVASSRARAAAGFEFRTLTVGGGGLGAGALIVQPSMTSASRETGALAASGEEREQEQQEGEAAHPLTLRDDRDGSQGSTVARNNCSASIARDQQVRPGRRAEGEQQVGLGAYIVAMAVGGADQEARFALATVAPAFELLGELRRRQRFAAFVEDDR